MASQQSQSASNTELKHFLPLSKLGQGSFSTVYKVKRITDGQIYALKKIKIQNLKQKQKINSLNEIRILASLKSKYIISYKEAFYDQGLNLLCIVMQCANGGDLQKKILEKQKNKVLFQEQQIWKSASEILLGLYVLHQKGILHRDLKSANVFISNQICKLGDLNVSKINHQKNEMAKTQTGTPYYASPEVWRDQPYNGKCDIWSLGCLIYEMCTFQPPFMGIDLDDLYKKVQRGKYKEISTSYSSELAFLIRKCLAIDPLQRPSAKELMQSFPKLKSKFYQSFQNKEIQISNQLLNTIRLPYDLRDLKKSLPIPQYDNCKKIKDIHPIKYQQTQKTQNSLNESISNKKKIIQPLPERIKQYLNAKDKKMIKRPERPLTSSKPKDRMKSQNEQRRPLSSVTSERKEEKYSNQIIKNLPVQIRQKIPVKLQKIANLASNPSGNNISDPNKYNIKGNSPMNYNIRSNSPSNKKRCISATLLKKRIVQVPDIVNLIQKRNQYSHEHIQKSEEIKLAELQKISYEKCKQNSLKKIDSLQTKVKYIRDQRKQRKYLLGQNKQNKQNCLPKIVPSTSQLIDSKPQKLSSNNKLALVQPSSKKAIQALVKQKLLKSRLCDMGNIIDIRKRLQLRKQKLFTQKSLHNRRYVVSAESKRRDRSMIEQQSLIQKDIKVERKVGQIRYLPSARIGQYRYQSLQRQKQKQIQLYNQQNLQQIGDNETIMRLKKRIKNRMGQQ